MSGELPTERLNRYLAACGVSSRRGADKLILNGAVHVNGQPVLRLGTKVVPGVDVVEVHGDRVELQEKVYLLLNKPRDVLCTSDDPQGRRTFLDLLPSLSVRVFCVGRLDRDSEGMLLVTNDGAFANRLLHPSHHVVKEYEVWLDRDPKPSELHRMLDGVESGDDVLRALRITSEPERGKWTVDLGEGKNRHIRRMFKACGIEVVRLRRVAIGPLRLGRLRRGACRELTAGEIDKLMSTKSG